jgi:branched-chain amino acid transport system substrate-binding protein
MGQFSQGQFISAPLQLQPILDKNQIDNVDQAFAEGDLIFLENVPLYKTRIVYVGIDINEFSQIDIDSAHEFSVDFYLWFRYQGELDIENIRFDNVSEPIELSDPIKSTTFEDGTNYRLYHIQATFSDSYDLREYPFDKQRLKINFRHADSERHELIYVVDILGMSHTLSRTAIINSLDRAEAFNNITDWHPTTGYFFQDTAHEYTTRGDPTLFGQKRDIEYSRFNTQIEVQRDILRFTAKTMLPVLFIIMLAYLGFFMPGKQFETISGIMTGTVLSVVFFHVDLSSRLNVGYNVALDYAFYIIYALLTTELLLSIIAWHKETSQKVTNRIFWAMRILYPLVLITGTVAIVLVYNISV